MLDGSIGEIRVFAGSFAPWGWEFCDGQRVSIARESALFTILGGTYGSDHINWFNLPKLPPLMESDGGKSPLRYVIRMSGYYPTRS